MSNHYWLCQRREWHTLTHWILDKMAEILQMAFSHALPWIHKNNLIQCLLGFVPDGPTGSLSGLVLAMPWHRIGIVWTYDDHDPWLHVVSLGHNELMPRDALLHHCGENVVNRDVLTSGSITSKVRATGVPTAQTISRASAITTAVHPARILVGRLISTYAVHISTKMQMRQFHMSTQSNV